MSVLVDSSVWIEYFRGTSAIADRVDALITENMIVGCDVVLAELIPVLVHRKEHHLAALLKEIERHPLSTDWNAIIAMQVTCLKHGINKVGIPDLLIVQYAIQHDYALFTLDAHFRQMARHLPFSLFDARGLRRFPTERLNDGAKKAILMP